MKVRPLSHGMSLSARTALLGALAAALLAGCVVGPPPRPRPPPPPPVPAPDTTVYAYPEQGQTPEQLDRDRYECYLWATKQTGFDPSAPNVPPHDRVVVVGGPTAPPGAQTAVGAVTGSIIGALIAPPRAAGFGAFAGALVGGSIGANAEAAQNQQAQYVARENYAAQQAQMAQMEQKASDYRRALSACLEGRGYTVK